MNYQRKQGMKKKVVMGLAILLVVALVLSLAAPFFS